MLFQDPCLQNIELSAKIFAKILFRQLENVQESRKNSFHSPMSQYMLKVLRRATVFLRKKQKIRDLLQSNTETMQYITIDFSVVSICELQ